MLLFSAQYYYSLSCPTRSKSGFREEHEDEADTMQFANCLTVPHIPVFLLVLLLTPPTFLLVATPILLPLIRRLIQAYTFSRSSDKLRWWWDWWLSWVVFFGPTGRFGGGTILGWRELDRLDDSGLGGGVVKLRNGVFVLLGFMLSAVCCVSSSSGTDRSLP